MRSLFLAVWLATHAAPAGEADLARAQQTRVALLTAVADDPLAVALHGELGVLGFITEVHIEPDNEVTWVELRLFAEREQVAAAIWIAPDGSELVIWVDDRGKGRAIVRSLLASPDDPGHEVLVLRAVELLRASLRETAGSVESEEETTPVGPVEQEPRHRPESDKAPWPHVILAVGPSVLGAPGGLGAQAQLSAGMRWMPARRFGLRALALAPTWGAQIQAPEGRARIHIAHVVGGPHMVFRDPGRVLQPDISVLLGASIVRMAGRAQAPAVGQVEHVLGLTGRANAGLAVVVHPALSIRLDAAIGFTAPAPAVAFASRVVARFGQPYGLGSLGLEFRLARRGAKNPDADHSR